MIKSKSWKIRGNALLSSVLVLTTCLIFIQFYLEIYQESMENNFLLVDYLINNWFACSNNLISIKMFKR